MDSLLVVSTPDTFDRIAAHVPAGLCTKRLDPSHSLCAGLDGATTTAIVAVESGRDSGLVIEKLSATLPVVVILPKAAPITEAKEAFEAGACHVLREPLGVADLELAMLQATRWRDLSGDRGRAAPHVGSNGAIRETLRALGSALDTRDPETQEHAIRVVRYALKLGEALGMEAEELVALERGATLHDVGKIGVPDGILMKPAQLRDAEWHCMRNHPEIGYDMLVNVSFLAKALPIILYHHEKYDGGGYPKGLSGADIPLGARIFAVVDAFDAMTSDRPYRKRMSLQEAIAELERCAGAHFDPQVVAALTQLIAAGDWPESA